MGTGKANGAEVSAPAAVPLPAEAGGPGPEKVRRTRSSASLTRSHAAKKANGHANGSANHAAAADGATGAGFRTNGHDHANSSVPAAADSPLPPQAGSDDQSGDPVANAAASSAAAGTDRRGCAEPANGTNGKVQRISNKIEEELRVPSEMALEKHSPGEGPLPSDPGDFVEEIHQRVDLFEIWRGLLNSEDEKIRQRAVEKLTEMRYKSAAPAAEEPPQIIFDLVRPKRED